MVDKRFFTLGFLVMIVAALAAGCVSRPQPYEDSRRRQILDSQSEARHSRDNPSYIQQLASVSLLEQAENVRQRLGESPWPGLRPRNAADFLRSSSVWLEMNPMQAAWQNEELFFAALNSSGYAESIADLGIDGLFLISVSESGTSWNVSPQTYQAGRDLVSMEIAERYGDEATYAMFRGNTSGLAYGGELIPAATGLGADFSMALRAFADYTALYNMIDVPAEYWDILPLRRYSDQAVGRPLAPEQLLELRQAGILAPAYPQDLDGVAAGWAATTEIAGQDAQVRRWLYRYYGNAERPVLDWDDPSGLVKNILSANIDQQIEIMGHSLIGLNTEAWRGLTAQLPDQDLLLAEPALSALASLAEQIHAKGGLVLLQDEYAPENLARLQTYGADFVKDTVLSPALEYAMLTGDAETLRQAIDVSLTSGLNHASLWRATANGDGLNLDPTGLIATVALELLYRNPEIRPEWIPYLQEEDNRLYLSSAGLAAVVSGHTPHEALLLEPEALEIIQAAHLLQIAFRAFQPGLLMLSARDLEGTLFAQSQGLHKASQTAWSLDGNRLNQSWSALTADVGVYAPLTRQIGRQGTLAEDLRQILALRDETQVASGQLTARLNSSNPSVVGVLVRLPDGEDLLVAGNFSAKNFTSTISSGLIPPGSAATDLITKQRFRMDGNSARLRFTPWQFRVIHIHAQR